MTTYRTILITEQERANIIAEIERDARFRDELRRPTLPQTGGLPAKEIEDDEVPF